MMTPAVISVTVAGESYPCRVTMGAVRQFRNLEGREISEVQVSELSAMGVWLYCCTASACRADGRGFTLSLDEFLDALAPEDIGRVAAMLGGGDDETPAAEDDNNTPRVKKKR